MISEKMRPYVENNSAIRAMFEEGKRMAVQYGAENVYDFSLGNPSVPAPPEVDEAIADILKEGDSIFVHGYMSNSGYEDVREAVAQSLNCRYQTHFRMENILMTVGAAGGLNVILKTLLNSGDEVITFAPYFVDYGSYVRNYDGKLVVVSPDTETFEPNLDEFADLISRRTKAVIINTPNNPTGVVYSENTLKRIAEILCMKETEYNSSIYLLSDEPYRDLTYDGVEVPYVTHYYHNAIICFSYSKSLSLPGERIGYLVMPDELDDSGQIIEAAAIATRVLGFINAPSLMQRAVMRCLDAKVEVEAYEKNRNLLYDSLRSYGFSCIKPQGAFYLFLKSPQPDEKRFCDVCKKHRVLVVPGSSFACPGFVRIAYCVPHDMISRALPAFQKIAEEYGLKGVEA